jgi:hypothetical protein
VFCWRVPLRMTQVAHQHVGGDGVAGIHDESRERIELLVRNASSQPQDFDFARGVVAAVSARSLQWHQLSGSREGG